MPEREHFTLTPEEQTEFTRIRPIQGEAFDFWRKIARTRRIDPASIISNASGFTALPLRHRHHWCFPSILNLPGKPKISWAER